MHRLRVDIKRQSVIFRDTEQHTETMILFADIKEVRAFYDDEKKVNLKILYGDNQEFIAKTLVPIEIIRVLENFVLKRHQN